MVLTVRGLGSIDVTVFGGIRMPVIELQDKTLVQVFKENGISITVLNDEAHPDFSEQEARLIKVIQDGQITNERIEALSKVLPSANEAFLGVSKHATASQTSAFETLKGKNSSAYTVIERIVEKASSESVLLEVIRSNERMHAVDSANVREMNTSNNNTYKLITNAILAGLVLLAIGVNAKSPMSK